MQGVAELGGRRRAGDVKDLLGHMLRRQGIEVDPLGATTVLELGETRAHRVLGRELTGAERDDRGEPF